MNQMRRPVHGGKVQLALTSDYPPLPKNLPPLRSGITRIALCRIARECENRRGAKSPRRKQQTLPETNERKLNRLSWKKPRKTTDFSISSQSNQLHWILSADRLQTLFRKGKTDKAVVFPVMSTCFASPVRIHKCSGFPTLRNEQMGMDKGSTSRVNFLEPRGQPKFGNN